MRAAARVVGISAAQHGVSRDTAYSIIASGMNLHSHRTIAIASYGGGTYIAASNTISACARPVDQSLNGPSDPISHGWIYA